MLAQYLSSDSGAAALGIIIALAVIALQVYLIYAIIATRQDVKSLKEHLIPRGPASTHTTWNQGTYPTGSAQSATPFRVDPSYTVVLREAGERPQDVERILGEQLGYARSGASGAVRHPGQQILATRDWARAQQVQASIQQAGGQAEIQGSPPETFPSEQGIGPSAAPSETKTCPDCAEEVRAVARKCRFCGHAFEHPTDPVQG